VRAGQVRVVRVVRVLEGTEGVSARRRPGLSGFAEP
jgi:hypothetical protein